MQLRVIGALSIAKRIPTDVFLIEAEICDIGNVEVRTSNFENRTNAGKTEQLTGEQYPGRSVR